MPCLQSCHHRQVAFYAAVVIVLRYISGIAVDSEVLVHLSTVPQWLLVVVLVLVGVQGVV